MKRVLLTVAALLCILTLVACGASVKIQNDAHANEEAIEMIERSGNFSHANPYDFLSNAETDATPVATASEPSAYQLGDVNKDGKINNLDLLKIFKYIYNPKLYPLEDAPTAPEVVHNEIVHDAKAPTCTEIGWNAYVTCEGCDHTTYVEIPATGHSIVYRDAKAPTCTEIGWDAYVTCEGCDYTTYVEIAATGHSIIYHEAKAPTETEIGWEAYETCENCDYTTYVELPILTPSYTEGLVFTLNSAGTEYSVTGYTGTATEVVIPAIYEGLPVTTIGDEAFENCKNLTSITVPNSVTSIGYEAFSGCTSLTSITIPDSVIHIGMNAFYWCTSLTSITIGNSVTTIATYTFRNCESLTSITIPDSVTSIGNYAFKDCRSLKTVYFTGTEEQWAAISIDSSNFDLTNAEIIYNYVPKE